jgi:hypothetical protein
MTPSNVINSPSIKKENVDDGILTQFVALSELLQEVDGSNEFYCGTTRSGGGNEQRLQYALKLMNKESHMSQAAERDKNVLK